MIVEAGSEASQGLHDLCVVGSGPTGMALALACSSAGLGVLLVESGGEGVSDAANALNAGVVDDSLRHAALETGACRALGGTGHWWGGRCIPFERIDFETRDHNKGVAWPITDADVEPWIAPACSFLQCGPPRFSLPTDSLPSHNIRSDQLERWCPISNIASLHATALRQSFALKILLETTAVDLEFSTEGKVVGVVVVTSSGLRRQIIRSRMVVLACGGVQTVRLLLAVQRHEPAAFGGRGGPLGRYYMGHMFGKIADIRLTNPMEFRNFGFIRDGPGYVRRRLTFSANALRADNLPNISFAFGNSRIANPAHGEGALSLLWLALASPLGRKVLAEPLLDLYLGPNPKPYARHLANVALDLPSAVMGGWRMARNHFLESPRYPSFIFESRRAQYSLYYHAEQIPSEANRITLTDSVDATGLPRARVSFGYEDDDADGVMRAHDRLRTAVLQTGLGELSFTTQGDATAEILAQASDGIHQIGGARMSADPGTGVVDSDCRVHGVENLYLAGSSVFPTSGAANPTFLAVCLALRLADRLQNRR